MKKVIEKTRPPHVSGGQDESPEPRTVFVMNPSWLKWSLKLQWVCIGRGRV